MSYVIQEQPKKFVIGIPVKTSNENFEKEALPLWGKFNQEKQQIQDRLNQNCLAVYTDYEGDHTQPFTFMTGCEVSNLQAIPKGMVGIEISASTYAVFTASGPFPQSLIQVWENIWNSDLKRTYATDFEVYLSDFNPEKNPEIKVYIAV
ncbi:MAG TPA: GyrI-like domain-containing protein [Rhabdochlamydiaceae bacterium]|nr:GyrI-like domain-containing protein [Rhabdochlamydiaceae bacterium]